MRTENCELNLERYKVGSRQKGLKALCSVTLRSVNYEPKTQLRTLNRELLNCLSGNVLPLNNNLQRILFQSSFEPVLNS